MGPFFICNVAQSILRPLKRFLTQKRFYLNEIVDNEDYYIDRNDNHLVVIHRVVDPVCFVDVSPVVARFEIMVLEA